MAKPKEAAAPAADKNLTTQNTALAGMFSDVAIGDDNDIRGNEDVGAKDMQIPRIDLLQGISDQIKKDSDNYLEGAEPGLLFNTLTGQVYGDNVIIIPIFYAFMYNLWIDRKKGGGFRGSYPTEALAKAEIPRLAQEEELTPGSFGVVETAVNYVYVIDENGKVEEASVAFARTKLSASRKLNSLIRMAGGARWRRAFSMYSIEKKNNKGEFYTFDVKPMGFISQELYARAEAAYDMFSKSYKDGTLKTNFDHDEADGAAAEGNGDGDI